MKKNWYAVYTKQHCELKVTALLTRKKIENYCPLNRIGNYHGYRKKMAHEPLFPSFVFVLISESEMPIIRQVNDVINFIYWLGKPAVIKDAEIMHIQDFIDSHPGIRLEKIAVNTNAMARKIKEPAIEAGEDVMTLKSINIKLLLPSLGYMLIGAGEKTNGIFDYNYEAAKMGS